MLKPEQRRLFQKFLILEMAVQSVQRDFSVIENQKMSKVYLPILERLLKDINHDYCDFKKIIGKRQNKIRKSRKDR
ncbi:hypothetical protein [Lysinibacillus fusiformis]|uniref:hypothetical protein n=1 Tax=Lysinibacillus fusiformis TaxID=28031 RepID=UPI003826EB86